MKRSLMIFLFLAALIGGAAWYGLNRPALSGELSEEAKEQLMIAEQLIVNGDPSKALPILEGLQESGPLGEKGQYLALKAYYESGNQERAAALAPKYLEQFADSEYYEEAEVINLSAQLALSGIANPKLRQSVEQFVSDNPDHPAAGDLQVALARQDLELGDHKAAHRRLEQAMQTTNDTEELFDVARALGDANLERLKSKTLQEGDFYYEVERGDTVGNIARKNNIPQELLMEINGIDNPRLLRIGQRLKIPNVSFSLHVDLATNTMELRNHGRFFKLYRVRTGREEGSTPVGEFKILNKKTDPTWRPGNGDVYLPGDPNNELGTRWMAFEGDILGIHGTLHPETVGHYASNGCVGMITEEVEELFDLIPRQTPLTITGERDLERNKVIPAPDIPPPMQMASN